VSCSIPFAAVENVRRSCIVSCRVVLFRKHNREGQRLPSLRTEPPRTKRGVYLVYFSGPVRPTLGNDDFPARGDQGNVVEHGDCLSLALSCRNAGSAYRDVVLPAAASGACMHAESERHAFWRLTETSFLVHFKSRGLHVRQWFALHCLQRSH
jgi:hypothetical protein